MLSRRNDEVLKRQEINVNRYSSNHYLILSSLQGWPLDQVEALYLLITREVILLMYHQPSACNTRDLSNVSGRSSAVDNRFGGVLESK